MEKDSSLILIVVDDDSTISSYIPFRTKNGLDAKVLCALLKNDFYSTYIDIIGIGTIRTSLGFSKLKKLKIPRSILGEVDSITSSYEKISSLKAKIKDIENDMQNSISSLII